MQNINSLIVAHRAGNSFDGVSKAAADGADIVETDVHLTKDGVLVAQYSPYTVAADGEKLFFYDHNYCEYTDPPNLLKDILLLAKRCGVAVLLDVKTSGKGFYDAIGNKIVELVTSLDMCSDVEVIAFDHLCISEIKRASKLRAGIMYVARLTCLKEVLNAVKPDFIEVCGEYLDEETVKIAQSMNVDVYGWGTDDPDLLRYYNSLGMKTVTVNDVTEAREAIYHE